MKQSANQPKPQPRPGAAKLNLNVDEEIGKNSGKITRALVTQAIFGNPTALQLILHWAKDAEFAEECLKTHGTKFAEWIAEIEAELAEDATAEAAKNDSAKHDLVN